MPGRACEFESRRPYKGNIKTNQVWKTECTRHGEVDGLRVDNGKGGTKLVCPQCKEAKDALIEAHEKHTRRTKELRE